jgi:hypothetical protein
MNSIIGHKKIYQIVFIFSLGPSLSGISDKGCQKYKEFYSLSRFILEINRIMNGISNNTEVVRIYELF